MKQPTTKPRNGAHDSSIAVAEATQRALTCLYSRNFLPANPFHLFAETFSGSVDQSGVWRLTNQQVVSKLQDAGPAVLTKSAPDLAHLSLCSNAWGLPHVLACVCRRGVDIICSVVADHLPRSFFPTFRPSDPDTDGYLVQALPSLQGRCISYQPDWQSFPLLEVRADVVVVGPSPTTALVKLARLVVRDATDLSAQVHYIQALVLQAPPKADGSVPLYVPLSLDMLSDSDEAIVQLLQAGIQEGSCIVCSMVVALKVPQHGSGSKGRKEWRHMPASKSYHLHVGIQTDPSLFSNVLPPIDSFTVAIHDALFTGVFLQEAAAKRYISLNKTASPYSQVLPNMTAMLQQLTLNYAAGQVLWAYHTLMLLTFLLDPQLSGAAPPPVPTLDPNASAKAALGLDGLTQLLDLVTDAEEENTAAQLSGPDSESRSSPDSESDLGSVSEAAEVNTSSQDESTPSQTAVTSSAASLGPLLIKMLNGVAAVLTGIAEELQALQWLLGQLQNQPSLPSVVEEKLLLHMHSLLTRILRVTTEAAPEGGRAVVQGLLAEALQPLTAAAETAASSGNPESSPDAMLANLATPIAKLQSLLTGIAMTHAQVLLHRAPHVAAFAGQLKVDLHLLDIKTGSEASPWIAPDWVLDVTKEAKERQQSRDFPDNSTVEGVLLQHAVDTRLYEALQDLHQMLTCPPIPANPFPRLTSLFLEYGCRLDHWESQPGVASLLWNEMTRLTDTDFMYKALPSRPHKQAPKLPTNPLNAQRASIKANEDGVGAVFGCYSAVAAADAEAVHGLAEKLPYFFKQRSWQSGAYQIDAIQTIIDDASFSNAFALHSSRSDLAVAHGAPASSSSSSLGGTHKHRRTVPAYLHERGFEIVTEEHYLVAGPHYAEAAQLFIRAFQKWLEDTHLHTEHVINKCQVGSDREFSLDELRERPHAVANALTHQLHQQADGCLVAEVHVAAAPLQESHRHPEGLRRPIYIPFTRQVVFQYQGIKKVKLGQHYRVPDDEDSWNDGERKAEDAAHWDSGVYSRLFLESSGAQLWESWNRERGDPALPFHHLPILAALTKAAAAATDDQDCMQAIKLQVRSALIANNQAEAKQAAKALRGLSQELTSLHGHMLGIIHTGTAQANAAASVLNWDRLQGALATVLDKTMYLMVIARLPLCNRGVSQEVEGVVNQLRAMRLRTDSWDSACMLVSQLDTCTLYCAAVHASISLGCLEKQCVVF